ncbi:MAG: type II toxin-antitoxin system PemK/MazF family toxin [Armatimonadetes bacterium]|nr:type II toxin-antitoxin system PemK/MazF family toxin [Armatimonadota bacterium]
MESEFHPARGEIYTARLDPTEGSELRKTRPVLIVSNDIDNRYSPVVLVVPLTEHKSGRAYPTEVLIHPPEAGVTKASRIQCTQIRVLDKRRLRDPDGETLKKWGAVSTDILQAVNESLKIALGLP